MKNKKQRGFTLIELLVVIAIIGLLATLVLIAVGPQRKNARIASVQLSMRNISTAGGLCIENGDTTLNTPSAGSAVCDSSLTKYGTLPTGWTYTGGTNDLTIGDETFAIFATGDSKLISCTQGGCTITTVVVTVTP